MNAGREDKKLLLIRLSRSGREKARIFNISEFKLTEIDSETADRLNLLLHRKTKKQMIVRVEPLDKKMSNIITCREVKLEDAFGMVRKQSAKEERKGRFTTYVNMKDVNAASVDHLIGTNAEENLDLVS